jgi:hypothetical protein
VGEFGSSVVELVEVVEIEAKVSDRRRLAAAVISSIFVCNDAGVLEEAPASNRQAVVDGTIS